MVPHSDLTREIRVDLVHPAGSGGGGGGRQPGDGLLAHEEQTGVHPPAADLAVAAVAPEIGGRGQRVGVKFRDPNKRKLQAEGCERCARALG